LESNRPRCHWAELESNRPKGAIGLSWRAELESNRPKGAIGLSWRAELESNRPKGAIGDIGHQIGQGAIHQIGQKVPFIK